MNTTRKIKSKRIICVYCKKPIHIDDFAGVSKDGWFCNNTLCLIKLTKRLK